jgi:hypothetical protein
MIDPIFFNRNKIHISNTTASLTASSTASGYAIDNAREDSLSSGWKPSNSSSDEWLKVDFGNTTSMGPQGFTAYCCVSYDARGADQSTIHLQYDSADSSSFSSPVDLDHFTLFKLSFQGVNHDYFAFTVPTAAKRYYRLIQKNADRGGGTKTATILYWGMFSRANSLVFPTDFPKDTLGRYRITNQFRCGVARTAGDVPVINEYAKIGTTIAMEWDHSTESFWNTLRTAWVTNSDAEAPLQAVYLQAQGLYNLALANFSLVRFTSPNWSAVLDLNDLYTITLEFETEPWL